MYRQLRYSHKYANLVMGEAKKTRQEYSHCRMIFEEEMGNERKKIQQSKWNKMMKQKKMTSGCREHTWTSRSPFSEMCEENCSHLRWQRITYH